MAWSTAICQVCCDPPKVAQNASEVTDNNRDLTQYIYVSTIQSARQQVRPNYKYKYKSQTERIHTLIGKLTNPESIAFRQDGGANCS
jgi:hypothetical protein